MRPMGVLVDKLGSMDDDKDSLCAATRSTHNTGPTPAALIATNPNRLGTEVYCMLA